MRCDTDLGLPVKDAEIDSSALIQTEKRIRLFATAQTNLGRGSRIDRFQPNLSKGSVMLYTLAVVLIILWFLGLVSSYTLGGFIHVLLVIAVIVLLFRVISGRGSI